ncbi:MAG: cbb3-type cytochrome oxidase subunit 3 [Aeromonas allosaccharophila]
MAIMIGIIVWAYSKRRKTSFDEAANLVFADDEQPGADKKNAGAKQ